MADTATKTIGASEAQVSKLAAELGQQVLRRRAREAQQLYLERIRIWFVMEAGRQAGVDQGELIKSLNMAKSAISRDVVGPRVTLVGLVAKAREVGCADDVIAVALGATKSKLDARVEELEPQAVRDAKVAKVEQRAKAGRRKAVRK